MAVGNLKKISDLRNSKNSQELIDHHRYVIDYYEEYNDTRARSHDFVRGRHWNEKELEAFRKKKKTPVILNTIKTSERTIVGLMIQNKYDVKYSPTEPNDQEMSDTLEQLRIWESNQQKDNVKEIDLFRLGWAGGNSFQECYMEITPGREPIMRTTNLNSFAVFFDPNSRELITRNDARFVDLVGWMSEEDMIDAFPESRDMIQSGLQDDNNNTTGYERVDIYKDRSHEDRIEKDGQYKVIERFYRVKESHFYAFDESQERVDIEKDDREQYATDFPDREILREHEEFLYVAISCESITNNDYLYNGLYHAQPREAGTGKIIFPVLEFVAESLQGEPSGFVEQEIDPAKIVNSMMSNVVHSAKHSASQAKLIDKSAFLTEKEANKAARLHSDADQAFAVKQGRAGDAMEPIKHSNVSNDTYQGLQIAKDFQMEITSTPPALQGAAESGNISGVLNAQRIEQSYTQLQVINTNWREFMKRRAELRFAYWREFYTHEKVFRVLEKKDKAGEDSPEFMHINQQVPETDVYGNPTGGIKVLNDISAAEYDITIEESSKSPTFRYKMQQQITDMLQSTAVQQDPVLMQALFLEWVRLSDASQELKDKIKNHSTIVEQYEQQKKQMEEQAKMQEMAQAEAEQTVPEVPAGAEVPPPGIQQAPPQIQADAGFVEDQGVSQAMMEAIMRGEPAQ